MFDYVIMSCHFMCILSPSFRLYICLDWVICGIMYDTYEHSWGYEMEGIVLYVVSYS